MLILKVRSIKDSTFQQRKNRKLFFSFLEVLRDINKIEVNDIIHFMMTYDAQAVEKQKMDIG